MSWRTSWVVVLVVGCSSSHQGDDPRAFIEAYEDAVCERAVLCEGELGELSAEAQHWCHPSRNAGYRGGDVAVAAGRMRFDRDAARACLEAVAAMPCRTSDMRAFLGRLCPEVFERLGRERDACDPVAAFSSCQVGLFCAGAEGCEGVCAPAAAVGESCGARPCGPGAMCALEDDELVCVARPALGEACTDADVCNGANGRVGACEDGVCVTARERTIGETCGSGIAACEAEAFCDAGVCAPRRALGASCPMISEACVDGLRCASGLCTALAVAGERCTSNRDCASDAPFCTSPDGIDRSEGARCSADATGASCPNSPRLIGPFLWPIFDPCPPGFACDARSGCRPIAALGSACGEHARCAGASRCVDGRCVAVVGPGEACGAEAVCPASDECRDGRCVPLPDLGEPCVEACGRGDCTAGVCRLRADGAACTWSDNRVECQGICGPDRVCIAGVPEGGACGFRVGTCSAGMRCVADGAGLGTCMSAMCGG